MRSITDCWACSSLVAATLSPAPIAFLTFLIAVRSDDLRLALRCRVASACRARLRAWAVLAMGTKSLVALGLGWVTADGLKSLLEPSKKTGHNSNFPRFAQADS